MSSVPPAPAALPFAHQVCMDCGAELSPGATKCWLCHKELLVPAELVTDAGAPPPVSFQFSIQTILLVTTLVAVCLGALVTVPGLGALAIVVAAPALIRTFVTGAAMKREGHKLTATDKVMAFFASTAVALAAMAAACIAFFATCTASVFTAMAVGEGARNMSGGAVPFPEYLMWAAFVLCCAASLGAFIGMFWITRPYIPKRR